MPRSPKPILRKTTDEDDAPTPPSSDYAKRVWFDQVEIKYHNMIMGDNPGVSEGAPITIDWKAHDFEVVDVDCYECTKPKRKSGKNCPRIDVQERAFMLMRNGYSIDQLAFMTQEVQRIQEQRAQSSEVTSLEKFSDIIGNSGKIFARLTRLQRSKKTSKLVTNPAA